MSDVRRMVHLSPQGTDVTSCCGVTVTELSRLIMDEGHLAISTPEDVTCAGLCRRCGERPGRERYYQPGQPGEVSVKQTVGCDECWARFVDLRREAGYPEPNGSSETEVVEAELVPGALVPVTYLGSPPPGYREYGDPWPPPSGRWWRVKLAVQRGWDWVTALLHWAVHEEWAVWTVVWLVGLALIVVGGGFDGVVAAVGLVATGVGGGLFIRWLWEVLS